MSKLQDYVKEEFFELPIKHWSDEMVKSFIIYSSNVDTGIHDGITNIDHADLIESVKDFDLSSLINRAYECQAIYTSNAKQIIKRILRDIEEDSECEDEAEDQRLEGISLDNQRLM